MNAIEKALWFIESHFASEITLEDLAKAGGVSRFSCDDIRCSDGRFDHALRAWPPFDRGSQGPIERCAGYLVRRSGCRVRLT